MKRKKRSATPMELPRRGRPPEGPGLVEGLAGSESSRQRLKAILETIAGTATIDDACQELGLAKARFCEVRHAALQSACEALEPKPVGRPRTREPTPEERRIAELEKRVLGLELELRASRVREEIALVLPNVLLRDSGKKGGAERFRSRSTGASSPTGSATTAEATPASDGGAKPSAP